jgi:HK97 gp10 family phage protein
MASTKETFKLEGFKELEDALLELPKATQGNVLKRAITLPAADFADAASRIAPSPGKYGHGTLKAEIKVGKASVIAPGKAAFAAAMKEGGTRAEAAQAARNANRAAGGRGKAAIVRVGPTQKAFYGVFQEFGTAHHAAHPFMRPTWDSMGPGMIGQIGDVLGTEIEKARARLAKKAARPAKK